MKGLKTVKVPKRIKLFLISALNYSSIKDACVFVHYHILKDFKR